LFNSAQGLKAKQMQRLVKKILRLASTVVVVLTFLSYLAPHVNPSYFRGLVFFGTAFPWLLWANVILMLLWAYRWNRYTLYHLGILLIGWYYVTCFIGFDLSKNKKPDNAITVATHNLGRMWPYRADEANYEELAATYAAFLNKQGAPDILCTQETRGQFYRELASIMGYKYNFNLKKGTVILSKYPMSGGGEVPFEGTKNSSLWVDVKIGKQVVRVYNVHLQSNKVSAETEKVLGEGEMDKQKAWEEIVHILKKVGGATRQRAVQARTLHDHIVACPHPVIVCGDFNDTPNSYAYRILSEGLVDTFKEKGFGLGTTFAGPLPFLRIDYILTEPGTSVHASAVVKGKYSDHYPVFATLSFERP
jgi:endonuclease/exonuclease/phosphatase family metal-dependent hydrolase